MTNCKLITAPLAAALALLSAGAASAAGVPPADVGYYSATHYVISASDNGAGQCVDMPKDYFTSSVYYPGPSKPGAMEWRPVNLAGILGQFIQTFPTTPPSSTVTTWSGTYTSTFQPGGTPTQVTFNSTNTRFDARSSVSTVTYSYPTTGGGTCTTMEQITYSYSGK